eukprot:TRINITY_DN26103_c0_g1_i1.p1 TRINITY_DN26103_c0_g1~~TRINITY_DN26103_c0_g1_i1.p1  ORF type:complete len:290 (+),score=48.74 TRINITY_DN26103_c0_g1_i1:78-947(+)
MTSACSSSCHASPESEFNDWVEQEAFPNNIPSARAERPSDRAARRRALESRLRAAHEKVQAFAAKPLIHGRCAIGGLLMLVLIRSLAAFQGELPGYSVFCMHFLTSASDLICIACSAPFYVTGTRGTCVRKGCLGPMLTLVFAMTLVDICSMSAYLLVATPRPLAPGAKSLIDEMEAILGVWEFAMLSSVALQLSLCMSSWRIYRQLRMAGLYAPDSPADVAKDKAKEISVLEIVCEADDIEYLQTFEIKVCDSNDATDPLLDVTDASVERQLGSSQSSFRPETEVPVP